jgi:hypothetical protein
VDECRPLQGLPIIPFCGSARATLSLTALNKSLKVPKLSIEGKHWEGPWVWAVETLVAHEEGRLLLVPQAGRVIPLLIGRGLHSSTSQLHVSAFCRLHASTSRLDVSTSWRVCWVVASAKTSQAELRSGGLLWLQ